MIYLQHSAVPKNTSVTEHGGCEETGLAAQKCLTYLGPADMMGHFSSVQKSVTVPYSMLIWLKKSTAERKERKKKR